MFRVLLLLQALADYQKRSLVLGGVPASVLPKIPKVQRLAAGMGAPGGRGGRGGGDFRRSGSAGTFGGRGKQALGGLQYILEHVVSYALF
jgi:hypothetical protein